MGNIMISIKRFLGNKNTVTILGVIIGIVVLYFGYNIRVKQAVEPQQIPYAKVEIASNTLITDSMLGMIKVSKSFVDQTPNLVTSKAQLIGKYVSYDTTIAEGGLFYKTEVMTEEQKPNYITVDLEECHTVYSLAVNMHTTYANSIMPGDYIDLFVSATNDSGQVIVTKFIESIKVRDVRDSDGVSVFSSASKKKEPAELIFSVPNKMFILLTKADNIRSNSIKIFPVPRNQEYTENHGETKITSTEMQEFIESKSDDTFNTVISDIDQKCYNE